MEGLGQDCGLLPTIKVKIPSNSDLSQKVQDNHLESTFKSTGIISAEYYYKIVVTYKRTREHIKGRQS